MKIRFRILPVLIFVTALMLTVRIGALFDGLMNYDVLDVAKAIAQQNGTGGGETKAPEIGGAAGPKGAVPEGMTPMKTKDADVPDYGDVSKLSPGEVRLLYDLADRRKQLDKRQQQLAEREALLKAAEERLVEQQKKLTDIRSEIEDMLKRYKTDQDQEQKQLIQVYSTMKPKSAAAILNDLEMDTLLSVVRGMSPRKIAPIIAAMNPEKARLVTRELADTKAVPELPSAQQ